MANEWHYTQNGQQTGETVTDAQLKALAVAGQLKPEDLVWKEGMPNWVPARSVKGLFDGTRPASGEMPATVPPSAAKQSRLNKTAERSKPPPAEEEPEQALHPLLVFLLTAVTFGLFGLFYAWRVSSQFSRSVSRTADSAGRPLGRVRHPVLSLMLCYLTLGFYLLYWISRLLQECAGYAERKDVRPRLELNLMLICPPYAIYLAVSRLPPLVREVQARAGLPESPAPGPAVFFLAPLLILGVPILCMIHQDNLNQVWVKAA